MNRQSLSFLLNQEDEIHRIRTVLTNRLGVSTRFLRACRNEGDILLNGVHVRTVDYGKSGDRLTLVFPKTLPPEGVLPEPVPFAVLYEDADFLAVQKNAGIPVHPSKGHPSGTLLNGIVNKILNDSGEFGETELYEPHLINRLDMGTSGIVLIGKNAYVQEAFENPVFRREIVKEYYAVVQGLLPEPEGILRFPIGQPDPESVRRAVLPIEEGGYEAVTGYRVLSSKGGFSLVKCRLFTGRTHQIRVHLSSVGCPIVGDTLYGVDCPFRRPDGSPAVLRQALEAVHLAFYHPVTHEAIDIHARLSSDLRELLSLAGLSEERQNDR